MMEILEMAWTILTTPNEQITTLVIIPLSFLEAYVFMFLFTSVLDMSPTKKQKIIYIITISILAILSRYVIPNPYGSIINMIFWPFIVMLIFKISFLKGFIAEVIPLSVSMCIEIIIFKSCYLFFNLNVESIMNIPIYRTILLLVQYCTIFLLTLFLRHFKFNIRLLDSINSKGKLLFILNSIAGIVLIATQIYLINYYNEVLPFAITITSIISLIAYFTISIYSILSTTKLETTSMNLEEAQLYNKTLEILQDNTRAFRHDFSNILQGMVGYIDNNDIEGLRKYYSQLLEDVQHSNNLTTLSPKVVNNPAIYNVLATKYHKADSLGIKINLEAFLDLNELHMKIYEFTRVLGILMDNAIEATCECENKIINVTFRKDTKKHMQLLIIENTYKNKNIDTEKIFEKGYSTKEGNTGLGLWEIRQILKKNNNLNLYTTKNSEFFTQQFEIYY